MNYHKINTLVKVLSQGDIRIKELRVTVDKFNFTFKFKAILKKPFDHIMLDGDLPVITDILIEEFNQYHPMLDYIHDAIKRAIDEAIIKDSYQKVKAEEVKAEKEKQEELKKLHEQGGLIYDSEIYSDMMEGIKKITEQKFIKEYIGTWIYGKSPAQKYYEDLDFKSTESGIYKASKVVKKEFYGFDPAEIIGSEQLVTVKNNNVLKPAPKLKALSSGVVSKIAQVCPGINEEVKCPGCGSSTTLAYVIVHLNDNQCNRKWSREEVADWIESLDINTEIIGAVK